MAKNIVLIIAIFILIGNVALADGKFYYIEKIPVGVPYQQALIVFENNRETLLLQSRYETSSVLKANSIAWVVPVPSVPDFESMDAYDARNLFFSLGLKSQPTLIPVVGLLVLIAVVLLLILLIFELSRCSARMKKKGAKPLTINIYRIVIGVIIFFILLGFLMPAMQKGGVSVLKSETVGIYNINVIKADDADALTQWLINNGFKFDQTDTQVFEQYVNNGWCFAAAKVGNNADPNSTEVAKDGMVAPLLMRFDSNDIIYPMALTGTTGLDTEVLLYTLSDHKLKCGNKLKLIYSGKTDTPFPLNRKSQFLNDTDIKEWQLCRFRGSLKPEQMKDDILFTQSDNDNPYKGVVWK